MINIFRVGGDDDDDNASEDHRRAARSLDAAAALLAPPSSPVSAINNDATAAVDDISDDGDPTRAVEALGAMGGGPVNIPTDGEVTLQMTAMPLDVGQAVKPDASQVGITPSGVAGLGKSPFYFLHFLLVVEIR